MPEGGSMGVDEEAADLLIASRDIAPVQTYKTPTTARVHDVAQFRQANEQGTATDEETAARRGLNCGVARCELD